MDTVIFISSTAILLIVGLFVLKRYENKGAILKAKLYPSILLGAGLGIVIGILAKGTVLETLVVMGFLILLTLSQLIAISRVSKSFKAYRKKAGK